jgi:hypothetical protein
MEVLDQEPDDFVGMLAGRRLVVLEFNWRGREPILPTLRVQDGFLSKMLEWFPCYACQLSHSSDTSYGEKGR